MSSPPEVPKSVSQLAKPPASNAAPRATLSEKSRSLASHSPEVVSDESEEYRQCQYLVDELRHRVGESRAQAFLQELELFHGAASRC